MYAKLTCITAIFKQIYNFLASLLSALIFSAQRAIRAMDTQEYVEIMEIGYVHLGRQHRPMQQRPKLQCLNIHWEGDLVSALSRSLKLAQKEYRIRVGFSNAMKILELDPASVVMCILPVNAEKKDPLSHLQLMLIEAYCTENGIRLLKVVSSDELSYLVKPLPETDDEAEDLDDDEFADDDCSLIVIQNSHHDPYEDYELQKMYDFACVRCSARPIIHLPS